MGYLSSHLQAYLDSASVDSETKINVVVKTASAMPITINNVPATADARANALDALRETGLSAEVVSSPTLTPRRLLSGVELATLQVAPADLVQLANSPGVEYVRPERVHHMHLNVSPGLLGVDAHVRTSFDGTGIRVAVIDSGIDAQHPDLRGRVDLAASHNFTQEGTPDDVSDRNGHGTHVAGIIGGAGATFRGVAPKVEFIVCKVFNARGRGAEGSVRNAVRWAIDHGADVINYSGGFAPVNPQTQQAIIPPPWVWPEELLDEETEFKRAMEAGIVSVVSAGNEGSLGRDGTLSSPATCPDVISVGAVDKLRRLAFFSSVGPAYRSNRVSQADMVDSLTNALRPFTRAFDEVDLVAPGGTVDSNSQLTGTCFYSPGIISTRASVNEFSSTCQVGSNYVRLSGTSQAAPHIAGLSALILQAAGVKGVNLGARRAYAVKGVLRAACTKLTGPSKPEQGQGLPKWTKIETVLGKILDGTLNVNTLSL